MASQQNMADHHAGSIFHEHPLLRPHRRADDLPPLRDLTDDMPRLPRVEASMKYLIEPLQIVY